MWKKILLNGSQETCLGPEGEQMLLIPKGFYMKANFQRTSSSERSRSPLPKGKKDVDGRGRPLR